MFNICLGEAILFALCPLDQKEIHDSRYMQGFQKVIISMVICYVTTEKG
jgi:hypothetical protein